MTGQQHKNTMTSILNNVFSIKPTKPTTLGSETCNIAEEQNKDLDTALTHMREVHKKINKYLDKIYENKKNRKN